MFKKGLIAIVLGLTLFISSAQCGEVRIMVGTLLFAKGENCKLIPSDEYFFGNTETDEDTPTLKEMVSEGWKINFVEIIRDNVGNKGLFILTKDK